MAEQFTYVVLPRERNPVGGIGGLSEIGWWPMLILDGESHRTAELGELPRELFLCDSEEEIDLRIRRARSLFRARANQFYKLWVGDFVTGRQAYRVERVVDIQPLDRRTLEKLLRALERRLAEERRVVKEKRSQAGKRTAATRKKRADAGLFPVGDLSA